MRPKPILGMCVSTRCACMCLSRPLFSCYGLATCMRVCVYAFTLISVLCFSSRSSIARRYFWFFVSPLLFRNVLIEQPKPMIQWTCTICFFLPTICSVLIVHKGVNCQFYLSSFCANCTADSIEQQVTCDRQLPPTAFRIFEWHQSSDCANAYDQLGKWITPIHASNGSTAIAWVVCDDGYIDIFMWMSDMRSCSVN